MARTTPESVFLDAQSAMAKGDLDAFFVCLDKKDLMTIARNSVNDLICQNDETISALKEICRKYSIPQTTIDGMLDKLEAINLSARAETPAPDSPGGNADMMEHSRQHQRIVKEYSEAITSALNSVSNLALFTADLEKQMKAFRKGGSVSGSLFVGETLDAVVIEGNKAWATRKEGSWSEDIGFTKKKGEWFIRLLARRPTKGHAANLEPEV